MYTRITHHIIEEHFNHPILAALAANIQANLVPAGAFGNVVTTTETYTWDGNTKPMAENCGNTAPTRGNVAPVPPANVTLATDSVSSAEGVTPF